MARKPVIAVAWFRAESYQRIREVCSDEMIPTFEAFDAKMTKAIADLAARGVVGEKVVIEPDELLAFASESGASTIDTGVRSQLAARKLAEKYGSHH